MGGVIFTVEFYLKHVRDTISSALAYEASIIGDDD